MSTSDKLDDLMLEWEAARQQGRSLSAEELCADFPSSLDELRRRMQAILEMEVALGLERTPARRGAQTPEPLPAIPGFDVLRVLDEGGMGIVYEARQRGLGRRVALKMMAGPRLAPKAVARFKAEAEAAARLHHPNFVQVFEVGHLHERPFFAMEYVEGGSLAAALDGKPCRHAARRIGRDARPRRPAAHEAGIVHRDLKPANVLLAADGAPRSATSAWPNASTRRRTTRTRAKSSARRATWQTGRRAQAPDRSCHGCLCPRRRTLQSRPGRPPFKGDNAPRIDAACSARAPTRRRRHRLAGDAADLEAICLKCLEKAPARRAVYPLSLSPTICCFLDGLTGDSSRAEPRCP
ncbi:MAG: serine/threonine-protein kinase [Gemmataceae bacterium]